MAHLVVALSAHGFGHAAMSAPAVEALRRRVPGLRVTLRTLVPPRLLSERYGPDCALDAARCDVGMEMDSALDVRLEDSARAYAEFHARWPQRVEEEARALEALGADCVLANVPYLALAGAARAGIPAFALSSLNWLEIYRHYFGARPEAAAITEQMRSAYASARAFFATEPAMPMPGLANLEPVGPVARIGAKRGEEIRRALGLPRETRLVLLMTGGLPLALDLARWPRIADVHWLVAAPNRAARADMTAADALGMTMSDVLASADAVVGKPGYGSVAEAACNAVPMLFVRRGDWPEEAPLVAWLLAQARALEVPRARLESGDLGAALDALWRLPARRPPVPSGADRAAEAIAACLREEASAGARARQ